MTKRLKVYLDTSIFNFAISAQSVVRERLITNRFLSQINEGKFEAFISEVVLQEIRRASQKRQRELISVLREVSPETIWTTQECENLADRYLTRGLIPARHRDDALHIAVASFYHLDVIVSWNFEHLVKAKTRREIQILNPEWGYPLIDIATPEEVVEP